MSKRLFIITYLLLISSLPLLANLSNCCANIPFSLPCQSYVDDFSQVTSANFIPAEINPILQNVANAHYGTAIHPFISKRIKDNASYQIRTIVIDPGHGGKDGGCSGSISHEKNIVLQIALELGSRLKAKYPDINIIYTRTKDVFIPLNRRAEIANHNHADLFISIHCNYIVGKSHIHGSETYVMGLHRAEENLEVAKRENESILFEEDFETKYDGYDPNSPLGHILLSSFQNAFLAQSILFANHVETSLVKQGQGYSRGVKQAGFLVLRKTAMPSVLIECGFLSNKKEENHLASEKGAIKVAESLLQAFDAYKKEVEISEPVIQQEKPEPIASKPEKVKLVTEPPKVQTESKKINYWIQLLASREPLQNTDKGIWTSLEGLQIKKENNLYKYLVGTFENIQEAEQEKQRLKELGFKDAFLAPYCAGRRMNLKEISSFQN